MNIEEAKKIVDELQKNAGLYVAIHSSGLFACLDGEFTVDELKAIVICLKSKVGHD